ncbi:MAG: hypothetical protein KJZ75_11290 [Hyphomonadaceae bacterium]|nr:hypothetical protein [Hyphomonadaceae bacterium]
MAEQTITLGDAFGLVAWVIGIAIVIIGGLAGLVITIVLRNADRTSAQGDRHSKGLERASERHQERQVETAVDLSAMQANVALLMKDRGKCDDLGREVAVLSDFKNRAEAKFDEVDDVAKAQERLGEQMRTVFKRLDAIDEKIDRVPRETADVLRTMIRPAQPARASNG